MGARISGHNTYLDFLVYMSISVHVSTTKCLAWQVLSSIKAWVNCHSGTGPKTDWKTAPLTLCTRYDLPKTDTPDASLAGISAIDIETLVRQTNISNRRGTMLVICHQEAAKNGTVPQVY